MFVQDIGVLLQVANRSLNQGRDDNGGLAVAGGGRFPKPRGWRRCGCRLEGYRSAASFFDYAKICINAIRNSRELGKVRVGKVRLEKIRVFTVWGWGEGWRGVEIWFLTHAMDSSIFLRKIARRRMAANGLGIILFRYADWLQEKGYGRNTIHLYTQAVEHFGFWRARYHPRSQRVQASEVTEFLNSHLTQCNCPPPAATSFKTCQTALNRLMAMLGSRKPWQQLSEGDGPIATLLGDFDQHMRKVCGLSPATRFYRRRYAREFLRWRFDRKRWDLTKLCFANFVDYVKCKAPRLKPASVGVMVSSLRSLVRIDRKCRGRL
jgi:hypothetical protein